ncbi:hypothetical protein [Nonomuraea turkmeniaca]|uniref:hypothetical protein n=1 Tax=Nonomuraea turkmeniaca TaxID=103838 RepID=UPI001FE5F928|nr:hypothetical protein [Nonomuraea turkmeniaca]
MKIVCLAAAAWRRAYSWPGSRSRPWGAITTTMDSVMQAATDRTIRQYVHASDTPVAAQALVQPGTARSGPWPPASRTGGARPRTRSRTTSWRTPRTAADRVPAGATFKSFTLISALKQGMNVDDELTAGAGLPRARLRDLHELLGRERRRCHPHGHQRRGLTGVEHVADRHVGLGWLAR